MCAAKSTATASAQRALSLFPPVYLSEVIGHLPDLVLRPQRAAADHAVERALPGAAVLALVHPHVGAVALEALRDEHFLSRRVGESDRGGGLFLLRERGLHEQGACERRCRKLQHRLYVAQCPARPMRRFAALAPIFVAGR